MLLRGWVAATALHVGDQVRNRDGSYGTVTAITRASARRVVYNLTVAEAVTFFVGDDGWLVHNACGGIPKLHRPSLTSAENDAINETLAHIRNGTKPSRTKHWGGADSIFANDEMHLPTIKGEYHIYDVPARSGDSARGTRRIIVGDDGSMYYTNSHYGQRGGNPFYRLR